MEPSTNMDLKQKPCICKIKLLRIPLASFTSSCSNSLLTNSNVLSLSNQEKVQTNITDLRAEDIQSTSFPFQHFLIENSSLLESLEPWQSSNIFTSLTSFSQKTNPTCYPFIKKEDILLSSDICQNPSPFSSFPSSSSSSHLFPSLSMASNDALGKKEEDIINLSQFNNPCHSIFDSSIPWTYVDMISTALVSVPTRQLCLEHIYAYIAFHFFPLSVSLTKDQKHAVKFTLVTEPCFQWIPDSHDLPLQITRKRKRSDPFYEWTDGLKGKAQEERYWLKENQLGLTPSCSNSNSCWTLNEQDSYHLHPCPRHPFEKKKDHLALFSFVSTTPPTDSIFCPPCMACPSCVSLKTTTFDTHVEGSELSNTTLTDTLVISQGKDLKQNKLLRMDSARTESSCSDLFASSLQKEETSISFNHLKPVSHPMFDNFEVTKGHSLYLNTFYPTSSSKKTMKPLYLDLHESTNTTTIDFEDFIDWNAFEKCCCSPFQS